MLQILPARRLGSLGGPIEALGAVYQPPTRPREAQIVTAAVQLEAWALPAGTRMVGPKEARVASLAGLPDRSQRALWHPGGPSPRGPTRASLRPCRERV